MSTSLADKTAIITGGASVTGRAAYRKIVESGGRVVILIDGAQLAGPGAVLL